MKKNDQIHKESWSAFYHHQKNTRFQYTSNWKLPLIKKVQYSILPYLKNNCSVLDVGAYDRRFESFIRKHNDTITYKSYDIDPLGNHDYTSFDQIEDIFDIVLLFEVIEHISVNEAYELLENIYRVSKKGSYIIISTPNIHHPYRYLNSPDHITPYRYDALGGILSACGFNHEIIYRVHNEPFIQYYFRRYIGHWLHRYLDIDYAHTIVAVGRK